ncbi:MAG TPA: hypothetical protein PLR87_01425 [Thermoanaerobaculaceae bacterium]|nr:hypothetical protein [Thermoanaerobaculaceae bacterium]
MDTTPAERPPSGVVRSMARFAPGIAALLALFALYATFRQRYVGASDWYGYYALSRLFLEGRVTMPMSRDTARYPAAAPLGFEAGNGCAIPRYPPGYPLLMAVAGVVGAEFFVTPLCGALSVLVLYLILIRRVSRFVAVLMSAQWALSPPVVWGAVSVMSDLPAALWLLTTYCLLDRDRPALAGAAFALAVATRPTNALFGLLLLPLLAERRRFARFAAVAAACAAVHGLYNWQVFGAPWRMGYHDTFQWFRLAHAPRNFPRFGWHLVTVLTAGTLLPAFAGALRRGRRNLFFLGWFLLFWGIYSFWWVYPDVWWWLRFLLPGLPGLFILAADGWDDVLCWLEGRGRWWRLGARIAGSLGAATLIAFFVRFGQEQMVFTRTTARVFHDVAESARKYLPAGALVGAFEHTGSLRLYGGFETFRVPWPGAAELVRDELEAGQPVYLLLESSLNDDVTMKRLLEEYEVDGGVELGSGPGPRAVRVIARKR